MRKIGSHSIEINFTFRFYKFGSKISLIWMVEKHEGADPKKEKYQ